METADKVINWSVEKGKRMYTLLSVNLTCK